MTVEQTATALFDEREDRVRRRAASLPHARAIIVGTAGEHMVCADVILRGHNAFITSAGLSYDVLADVNGRLFRVAVKSTLKARPRGGCTLARDCYQFNIVRTSKDRYTTKEADIVALVGLDIKDIGYVAVCQSPTIMHFDVPGKEIVKTNRKGPAPGKCRTFSDFTFEDAIANCIANNP